MNVRPLVSRTTLVIIRTRRPSMRLLPTPACCVPRPWRPGWPVAAVLAGALTWMAGAADPSSCPATPEERQSHARPVLSAGARPWAMGPLPASPPAPPLVALPVPHSEARRHLLRRLTFVLSGLPPREDDAAAFLAEVSPRALDRALDRLLAASTAPQRLGEVWLRATGYADRWPEATGQGTLQPEEAWRYRDWVVANLRTTPQVHRLARLTLSGDSQTGPGPPNRSSQLATLWHVTGPPVSSDFEEAVVEWSGRQAERTTRAFLGLDLSCARCHDHPALPLPSDQAAGLVAIFAHSHAFVRQADGRPGLKRISTSTPAARHKRAKALEAVAADEAALEARRREFALVTAEEFLPQTAEYVRAAWAWHKNPTGTLAAFSATRGLLAEPLARWLTALGLDGEPPPPSLRASWWAQWEAAREAGTTEAIASAARAVQEAHRIDIESPFFSTSPAMDAFFTLDQQTQLARQMEKIATRRKAIPEDPLVPTLAEGSPPDMDPPALTPSLPALLTGESSPTPITPPGAGRRALATWLEGEGATFFARLAAVRLAEGLGHPLLPEPTALRLWTAQAPPEAGAIDEVAACLVAGGWPAAAKRILLQQARDATRPPLSLGGSEWRDAVLFVSGTLDPRQGGPPDPSPESPRRSLYREWAPLPAAPTQDFLETKSAALAAFARRKGGGDPEVQLNLLTHRLFQRPPTPEDRNAFLARPDDLAGFCARLLQSEEFRVLP